MILRTSSIQGIQLVGNELRENVVIRDCSRASFYMKNRVELSDSIFPKMFEEGEEVLLHIEDRTQGRPRRYPEPLVVSAEVFYRSQEKAVVITIGTEYEKGSLRDDLGYLERIWSEDCGLYEVYLERRVDKALLLESRVSR